MTVLGWGKVNATTILSNVLQELEVTLSSHAECQTRLQGKVNVSETQLCASGLNGADSCSG